MKGAVHFAFQGEMCRVESSVLLLKLLVALAQLHYSRRRQQI
jgi:hypothetical protein